MTFHLAIPAKDLEESIAFYVELGAHVGRKYKTHAVLKFFEHQLVCHVSDEIDLDPKMYPRHFGIIFDNYDTFDALYDRLIKAKYRQRGLVFDDLFTRHKGLTAEHMTFFLKDPSNNLIEFKYYSNTHAVFG